MKIALITCCMGRLQHARIAHYSWIRSNVNGSLVFVDYSCPETSGAWIGNRVLSSHIVHVPSQKNFNLSKARNAGLRAAGELGFTHAVIFDCDMVLHLDLFFDLNGEWVYGDQNTIFTFEIKKGGEGFNGFLAAPMWALEKVGFYNEALEGYGYEDTDILSKLDKLGLKRKILSWSCADHIPHGDEDRVRFYEQKDKSISHLKNMETSNAGIPKED